VVVGLRSVNRGFRDKKEQEFKRKRHPAQAPPTFTTHDNISHQHAEGTMLLGFGGVVVRFSTIQTMGYEVH
jgi:hypothetical protein